MAHLNRRLLSFLLWPVRLLKKKASSSLSQRSSYGPIDPKLRTKTNNEKLDIELSSSNEIGHKEDESIKERLEELRELIRYHQHKYYVEDAPEIADFEYDLLKAELKSIEQMHPELKTPDSRIKSGGIQSSSAESGKPFYCWRCGTQLRADSSMNEYTVECPNCGAELEVPGVAETNDSMKFDKARGPDPGTIELGKPTLLYGAKKIALLDRHKSLVESVVFSPDGDLLASGSADKTIILWDIEARHDIATLYGHNDPVASVSFSPDGKLLASGSWDNTIKIWDVETGEEIATFLGHSKWVESVVFSPDGRLLASGSSDNTIKLWDVVKRKEIMTLRGHSQLVQSVAFSPQGELIASGSVDKRVKLWSVEERKCLATFIGHTGEVRSVVFNPTGRLLASAGFDELIRLWDLETKSQTNTLKEDAPIIFSVAFSPDAKLLASASLDNTIKLWEVETQQRLVTLKGHLKWVESVAFSPDGRLLASGSGDNTIIIWELTSKKLQELLQDTETQNLQDKKRILLIDDD